MKRTFTEKALADGKKLFYNPYPFDIPNPGVARHIVHLDESFIRPRGARGLHRVNWQSSYGDALNMKKRYMYWANKCRYPYLLAAFYFVKDDGGVTHKVLSLHADDLDAFYKAQNQMVEQYVLAEMTGQWPLE